VTADPLPTEDGARPRRADARRNRARLLEVAHEVFAAEGLSVPIDEIARRAGVGPGTIYRHFATKEALFQAVMQSRVEALVAIARTLRGADDAGAAFFDFFTTMIEEATGNKALAECVATEGLEFELGDGAAPHELELAIDELLRRAQQSGAVRADVGSRDIKALLIGCMATEAYGLGDSNERMIAVVRDGLRGDAPNQFSKR
jgi:AcrR family transcriptional regulator